MLKVCVGVVSVLVSLSVFSQSADLIKIDVMDAARQGAEMAVQRYTIVKKNGTPQELCHASFTATMMFRNANDEENYLRWRDIKRQDCQRAGLTANFGE